ncbi:hypothetical protein NDU88_004352, partial [Pleurodeles waltl]
AYSKMTVHRFFQSLSSAVDTTHGSILRGAGSSSKNVLHVEKELCFNVNWT